MWKYFIRCQADILVKVNSPFSHSSPTFSPPYTVDQIIPWYLGTILEVLGRPPLLQTAWCFTCLVQSRIAAVSLFFQEGKELNSLFFFWSQKEVSVWYLISSLNGWMDFAGWNTQQFFCCGFGFFSSHSHLFVISLCPFKLALLGDYWSNCI